ncbi:protein translocase subunit SecD [Desulforhopalus vacuolatus]|uniref:protein translocase subunit SecD n=1 Tax=Desulforhopalus vacuolatus TaxID=40414 RepID=UPI001965DE43|nr:protein translocase subunit SecD [Desulforhopalus vacuolatus]MBM9518406.1 protein translocase subunit SecD [Desulforhopalus vacuolatus]
MNRSLKLRLAGLFTVLLIAVITIIPSVFQDKTPDWWSKYLSPGSLRLGLDLQGGMHIILKVDLDKAEKTTLAFAANDLKETLAADGISAVQTKSGQAKTVVFTLPNSGAIDKVQKVLDNDFTDIDSKLEVKEGSFPRITLQLNPAAVKALKKTAVEQSLEILRNRIDEFGVAEPVIVRQGEDEIVIQLPGVKDPKRARALIGKTAQLEFKLVADSTGINLPEVVHQAEDSGEWKVGEPIAKLNRAIHALLPDNTNLYFESDTDNDTGLSVQIPILLENRVLMTGDMVKDANVRIGGNFNEPLVSLDFTSHGGKVFAQVTSDNVHRRLAIVLDNVVRSAPNIQEKILGGSAQITGQFTHEEASDLAIVLRVGALPAPVKIIQDVTVGASLGADSIRQGLTSGIFGTAIVLVFMLIYYRLSGVIANIALFINLLLLFAGLAVLNATLTLPGIAGIILTVGMAVDANVLIFERMREEYSIGKSVRSSIDGGFNKALSTIVDSQVTTLITALALFLFGTGPIKGFAVTLSLGIIFNLFAALFCSRLMFDTVNAIRPFKKLNFFSLVRNIKIDYMRLTKFTYVASAILVALGLFSLVEIGLGKANLGVDFTGGSMLQYKASSDFTMKEVRNALSSNGMGDINIQEVENEHRLIVKIKKEEAEVSTVDEQITQILQDNLQERGFVLESQSKIGSSVSSVLRNKAIEAIIISLAGVIIYLAFRFDLRFGLAGAAATFHDVLVVLGICWIFNVEITLLIVTALLTLAGYSLNDSVVVFDRIRENMNKEGHGSFKDIINTSINETLSRTIVTSLTTAIVLTCLYFLGGQVIHGFAFALLIGIFVGTYSSIFIASPLLILKKKTS